MNFNSNFAKQWLGSTEADAIRVLRPGGPFDTTWLQIRCLSCGAEVNQPLRWFHIHEYRCTCGGSFDGEDFKRLVVERTAEYILATKSDAEIEVLLRDDNE